MFHSFFQFVGIEDNNNIKTIDDFLSRYGGMTFLNGLYRIHKFDEIAKWTKIVQDAFPKYKGKILVFGFDWLGRNFALDKERNVVLICEPGTGEILNTQANFTDFHNVEIPEYHDACLASEFFSEWYEENGHNTLPYDKCVGYKVPLFLNGNDELNNLEVSDMEVYWKIMTPLINL